LENCEKYADGDLSEQEIAMKKRGMMYEKGYGEIVDYWLEEDMKLNRKDRRTNLAIFEQLKEEYGFEGSYRTVCAYIQEVEKHMCFSIKFKLTVKVTIKYI
jgi:hypothetical protein